jgi:hypothetical protein
MGFLQNLFGRRRDKLTAQWQTAAIQEICIEMIRQIPGDWESATLVLEVTERGLGGGLAHSAITQKRGDDFKLQDTEFVTPNAEVMAATRKFELGWVEQKGTFKKAIITAQRDGENWEIRSDYEHDDE